MAQSKTTFVEGLQLTSTPGKFREKNRKVIHDHMNKSDVTLEMQESLNKTMKQAFPKVSKIDTFNEKEWNPSQPGFFKNAKQKLIEADSASSFPQVLRAGIQTIVNSAYQENLETTYEDWTTAVPSAKDTELYAPLHGISFPNLVARQEKYPEASAAGLDIKLPNYKYGELYAVEKELIADDQTGQFQAQTRLLGEYMRYVVEAWVYGKLASVSGMSYGGMAIPISETKPSDESNYPYTVSTSPFVGGGFNRPATFGLITQTNVQTAKVTLMNQLNKLGLKMAVNGNRLVVGANASFDSAILMNSSFYPSNLAGTAGAVGQSFAINPIKGMADITVSRWMFKSNGTADGTSKAWYLLDDGKPWFVHQVRSAVEVEQEAPNSGQSFERDILRWKVSMRMNADFIDPRFVYQGNDGSVTS